MRVARAASRLVAYDNGYLFEFSIRSIMRWESEVSKKVKDGVSSTKIISNSYKGKLQYVEVIESSHPGYLHYLYHQATKVKGPKASFA